MGQMSKLGLSVDELTRDFKDAKDIPNGLKSLQDAMRFRQKSAVEAEEKVQELRKAGIVAEIKVIAGESKVNILSQKEVIQKQKVINKERLDVQKLEKEVSKDREKLVKLDGNKRKKAEEEIIKKTITINKKKKI